MRSDPFAKALRRESTDAERRLWFHLRAQRTARLKFRRQHPIGPYIVDFICTERRLIVEVDGGQHLESPADRLRDRWLEAQGFLVLRFWNNEVLTRTGQVLEEIVRRAMNR